MSYRDKYFTIIHRYTMFLMLMIGLFLVSQIAGQRRSRPIQPRPKVINNVKEFIELSFEVKIKGSGKYRPRDEYESGTWNIDRTYSGTVLLDYINDSFIPGEKTTWTHMNSAAEESAGGTPVQITIKDLDRHLTEGPGEAGSFENSDVVAEWEGNGNVWVRSPSVTLDREHSTYNVNIPLRSWSHEPPQVSYKMQTQITRSQYGYGGKPTSETRTDIDKKMSFDGFPLPTLDGLMEGGSIRHAVDRPLMFVDGHVDYASDDIYFQPAPDKGDGSAHISIRYRFEMIKNK